MERGDVGNQEKEQDGRAECTNGRRREGSVRERTPELSMEVELVGGVRDEGQLQCHDDSGKWEEGGRDGETPLQRKPVVCQC